MSLYIYLFLFYFWCTLSFLSFIFYNHPESNIPKYIENLSKIFQKRLFLYNWIIPVRDQVPTMDIKRSEGLVFLYTMVYNIDIIKKPWKQCLELMRQLSLIKMFIRDNYMPFYVHNANPFVWKIYVLLRTMILSCKNLGPSFPLSLGPPHA